MRLRIFKRYNPEREVFNSEREVFAETVTDAEGDRLVIETIAAKGADLSQPRHVRHFIIVPNRGTAEAVAERLRADGFTVQLRPANRRDWLVVASHHTVVNLSAITTLRTHLTDLAWSFSGDYDGWEAAAAP